MGQEMNTNICVNFAFKFAEYKCGGESDINAFVSAANDFKKEIKAIMISHSKEGDIRSYLFNDDSFCIYNVEGGYFKFRSQLNKKSC